MDRGARRILALALLLAVLSGVWLYQGLGPAREFVLNLRLTKLVGLITVATAVGVSTIIFQTVAANRVLTPSIMGFDALYVLLQTILVAWLGITGFSALPATTKFAAEVAIMVALAGLLFGTLLGTGARDVPRMILTGVILGILFRSLSGLIARVMDPNAYAVVQSVSFASFNSINATLLPMAALLTLATVAVALWQAPKLDVASLGRDVAVSLGLRHGRVVVAALALVAVLVSVSTALVGPVVFFGLIVAGLTHMLAGTTGHCVLLPAAALIGANILVAGQLVFERALNQQATLSVVIEFAGGLFFLFLLVKGSLK